VSGLGRQIRAEWTKFRTLRGRVAGTALAAVLVIGLGVGPGMSGTCGKECGLPVGPGGEEVSDTFSFVHRPMAGDGSITVRVAAFTGDLPEAGGAGVIAWGKAGLIVKDGTRPGSTYAAVMVTGGHGIRFQHDFTHDRAGSAVAVGPDRPRWLRLTRRGDVVAAEESADGAAWTAVGDARLPALPDTAEVGVFVTSPQYSKAENAAAVSGRPTSATATFDELTTAGTWSGAGGWTAQGVGGPYPEPATPADPGAGRGGESLTVTGEGDIAPAVSGASGLGLSLTQTLAGTFAGLVVMVVIGALTMTAEYRRGLIRTTLTAGPRRGQVLAAKVLVLGTVTFVAGTVTAAVVVHLGRRLLRRRGVYINAVTTGTELRLVVGTGLLLAAAAVFALGLGTLLRRGTTAVTIAIVATVLPYLLALTVLPVAAGDWLLRVTPAAAFAVQQSARRWPQVDNVYTPGSGYFPLPPWAGLGVLALWAAVGLGAAAVVLHRRDA
jgi:regulation of enolase protein 1 (concanavalin A-like superfamily)